MAPQRLSWMGARASRGRDDQAPAGAVGGGPHDRADRGPRRRAGHGRSRPLSSQDALRGRRILASGPPRQVPGVGAVSDDVYLAQHLRMTGTVLWSPTPSRSTRGCGWCSGRGGPRVPAVVACTSVISRPPPLRDRRAAARSGGARALLRRAAGARAARRRLHRGAPAGPRARPAGPDQGAAARPEADRGGRQHLRRRGALPGRDPPAESGRDALDRAARAAAGGGDRLAQRRHRRARGHDRRLPPRGRRQGLLPGPVPGAPARRGAVPRCGTPIVKIVAAGRGTYVCEHCQRPPRGRRAAAGTSRSVGERSLRSAVCGASRGAQAASSSSRRPSSAAAWSLGVARPRGGRRQYLGEGHHPGPLDQFDPPGGVLVRLISVNSSPRWS